MSIHPPVDTPIAAAAQQLEAGDWPAACISLLGQLVREGQNPHLLHLSGRMMLQQGQPQQAITLLEKARQLGLWNEHLLVDLAGGYQQTGQLQQALHLYEAGRTRFTHNAGILNNLGLLYQHFGRHTDAIGCYEQALSIAPDLPETCNNLGVTLCILGRFADAAPHFRKALELNPNHVKALHNMGNLHREAGQITEAIPYFQRALALAPSYAEAHFSLACSYQALSNMDDAIHHFRQTIAYNPDKVDAYTTLETLLKGQGKFLESVEVAQRLLQIKPRDPATLLSLGYALKGKHLLPQAIACYEQVLQRNPQHREAHVALGDALVAKGEIQPAIQAYHKALALQPNDGLALKTALTIPRIYQSTEEIAEWRERLRQAIGQLTERGLKLENPSADVGVPAFFLAYHGLDDRPLLESLSRLIRQSTPCSTDFEPTPNPKPKVGFITRFLSPSHSVGKVFMGLVEHLSRELFDVVAITVNATEVPAVQNPHRHLNVLSGNMAQACEAIRAENLDILFYLDVGAMDPFTYYLAYNRLARHQMVTWGYPETSGIDTLDSYISSRLWEPQNSEGHYTEQLLMLDTLPAFYQRPEPIDRRLDKAHFGLKNTENLYLCTQSLFKLHPDFDAVLADILTQDPNGRLILTNAFYPEWKGLLMRRFQRTMPEVCNRVRILDKLDINNFRQLVMLADVILDTPHFNGGITSYEAFYLGMPIATMPTAFMRGRMTAGLYEKMGITNCIATSPGEYAQLANRIATDKAFQQELKAAISGRQPLLFEETAAVRQLEALLLSVLHSSPGSYPSHPHPPAPLRAQ